MLKVEENVPKKAAAVVTHRCSRGCRGDSVSWRMSRLGNDLHSLWFMSVHCKDLCTEHWLIAQIKRLMLLPAYRRQTDVQMAVRINCKRWIIWPFNKPFGLSFEYLSMLNRPWTAHAAWQWLLWAFTEYDSSWGEIGFYQLPNLDRCDIFGESHGIIE